MFNLYSLLLSVILLLFLLLTSGLVLFLLSWLSFLLLVDRCTSLGNLTLGLLLLLHFIDHFSLRVFTIEYFPLLLYVLSLILLLPKAHSIIGYVKLTDKSHSRIDESG
jgi:hypothetical protein